MTFILFLFIRQSIIILRCNLHLLVGIKISCKKALRDSAIAASSSSTWDDIAGSAGGAKVCKRNNEPLFFFIVEI